DDAEGAASRGLASTQWFVHLGIENHSFLIDHCTFRRAGADADSRAGRAIRCDAPGGREAPALTVRSPELLINGADGADAGAQAIVGDSSAIVLNGGSLRAGAGAPRALRIRPATR